LLFSGLLLYYKFFTPSGIGATIGSSVFYLPFLLLHTAVQAFGFGLLIAAVTAKYRDLLHALTLIIQLWMYATPVIYPLSQAPAKYQQIMALNPMTSVVECF